MLLTKKFTYFKYFVAILVFSQIAYSSTAQNTYSLALVSSNIAPDLKNEPLAACKEKASSKSNHHVKKYFSHVQDINTKQKLQVKIKMVPRGALKRYTIQESSRPSFDKAVFGTLEGLSMWMMMSSIKYDPPLWLMLNIKFLF